jgi:hypothetical protein
MTEPLLISAGIGNDIDAREREQLELFPDIDGFELAIFYNIAGGGYEIRITTEYGKLVAVNRDSFATEILRDYANRHEEIQHSKKGFEEKWKIVDYDALGLPITEYELNVVASPGFGKMIGGTACCLGSFLTGFIIASISAENEIISETAGNVLLVAGGLISTGLGVIYGEKVLRRRAISAIKESRKPRVVR